ncbi:hypothetical protein TTHERM_00476740 (macronuclear) [Tetrahymena thermophila SB210]|uniref:Uncharacterized protein n=1 Tax=Tetrahymena thermophila (strain SB210) TaxID=312017 RepID=I7M844_TETTS|nr:hypothetical protein TTHERM_00476740 [Tetrahymena thermophila SB210]EAR97136.2 hypothetical protein TTHERM_00476740 [Tetrahymena thermophila SB210]|eukprot:XP_001017381.2 hypothetical protein TTHERM_00476740 [Tetrahymena thermophila SB210]
MGSCCQKNSAVTKLDNGEEVDLDHYQKEENLAKIQMIQNKFKESQKKESTTTTTTTTNKKGEKQESTTTKTTTTKKQEIVEQDHKKGVEKLDNGEEVDLDFYNKEENLKKISKIQNKVKENQKKESTSTSKKSESKM